MSLTPYLIIGGLVSTIGTGFFAHGKGKAAGETTERLKWETANVETLVESNTTLAEYIDTLSDNASEDRITDVDTGNEITRVETRIIEKIVEVPIETVIKVGTDCRLDYGIVELRNGWASGRGLNPAAVPAPRGYLSSDGTETLPGDLAGAERQ